MCRAGDIIIIESHKAYGRSIGKHPFVVLNDEGGQITGIDFDFISIIISSFKDEKQKRRKLSYPGNFPITVEDKVIEDVKTHGEPKDGFVKAEQFFFFQKDAIEYKKVGYLEEGILDLIIEFIENEMDSTVDYIIDNLVTTDEKE